MTHPRNIKTILGHDEVIATFKKLMAGGKLHHAWLLCGPKGIGKASSAYLFAKELLKNHDNDDRTFKLIENNTHPDMFVIESETEEEEMGAEIKVNQVRELLSFLHTTPVLSKRKVVIIDPVEMLNNNAANALLKALEEPSLHTTFLLVCNSFGSLPATIKSRCAILKFNDLSLENFTKALGDNSGNAKLIYEMSYGSLSIAPLLAKSEHLELLQQVKDVVNSGVQSLSQLMKLKKALSSDESWYCFTYVILRLIMDKIKQAALEGRDVEPLLQWYDRTHEALKEQEIFNLDRENVALSIFSNHQ
ncbi:MAG: polymerase delta subunit [Candidatus Midichloriaceae bacterium]|jgi:DNA polymerase-3 subunit delta'|nr:polymerase delta subunit [Candidatus Midichloriaceae bacterium]